MNYQFISLNEATDNKHKYVATLKNMETGRLKRVKFGLKGASDYTQHKDKNRRRLYRIRHAGMGENWTKTGVDTPGWWSYHILWGQYPDLEKSLNYALKKFKIPRADKITGNGISLEKQPHSAYKSMRIAKEGKTKNKNGGLKNWILEKWENGTALITDKEHLPCGKRGKKQQEMGLPSICRPTVKITSSTPNLLQTYTPKQLKKAIKIKQTGKMIHWDKL